MGQRLEEALGEWHRVLDAWQSCLRLWLAKLTLALLGLRLNGFDITATMVRIDLNWIQVIHTECASCAQ